MICRSEAKKRQDLAEAAEAMEESASKKAATRTTKKAPYRSSSRWSRLLKVSTLQRSIQIWGFALIFAIKYFLSTRKFTYGKKVTYPPSVILHCQLAMNLLAICCICLRRRRKKVVSNLDCEAIYNLFALKAQSFDMCRE